MKNSDKPAFPQTEYSDAKGGESTWGLTKREYFAAMAMQGLCASGLENYQVNDGYVSGDPLAEDAVRIADELLKQLEK